MIRPAESPGGFRNTDPALAPPGWCSRRHRTISAMRRARTPRRCGARRRTSAPVTISAGPRAARRYPKSSWAGVRTTSSPVPARSTTRARTSTSAVSRPWPPAFIRTAPPTLPGIPTKNSRPLPARGRAAAREDRERHRRRPRCTTPGPASRSTRFEVADEHDREPGESAIGHEQVRSASDEEQGRRVLTDHPRDGGERVERPGAHERARPAHRGGRW